LQLSESLALRAKAISSMHIEPTFVRLVQLNFGLSKYLSRYLDQTFEISSFFDSSRYLLLRPKFRLSESPSQYVKLPNVYKYAIHVYSI